MSMQIRSENLCLSEVGSIELAIESNKHLDSKLDEFIENNHKIDLSLAMKNLVTVGKILNRAYGGSIGFKCSTSTIKILSEYQSMIHNSCLACSTFVSACLNSLKYHKCAIALVEKDKIEAALAIMEKCSELASKMVKASEELANQADELCKLSEEALTAAREDKKVSQQEIEQIAELIRVSRAKQAELEANKNSLPKKIEEIQEEKQKIERSIDQLIEKADRENTHEIVNSSPSPATSSLKSTDNNNEKKGKKISRSEKLYQKEKELSDSLKDLEREERISNAEMAEISTKIKNLTVKNEDLETFQVLINKSIELLELSKKELGKIKTTFELTKDFWIVVLNHCNELTDLGTFKNNAKADLKDEVIEKLRLSGLQWLCLGKINYKAKEIIEDVSKQVDGFLNNLPTKSEAARILQDEAENLF
ncbi:hypothetical protein BpHYR1_012136 [Brachionus plicatilis]|uniref:Uncharacterized protein n=1 Tax=Brachionus plicatilis TaxID=10195 RepID=A0A3M7R822_BRAPC|nr:hypothetical protein BpHYR1_012136 [Brachionus plicatilis]